MTTDLFFAPALPRKLPSSFQCDRTETFSSSRASTPKPNGLSGDDKPEKFLATLNRAARDQNTCRASQHAESPGKLRTGNTDSHPENDSVANQPLSGEEVLMELMSLINSDETSLADQSQVSEELSELISLLEALGWAGPAGDRIATDGGELNFDHLPLAGKEDQGISAGAATGNKDLTGIEQLKQMLARALATAASPESLNQNQSRDPADLLSWARGIIQGQNQAVATDAVAAAEGNGTEKSSVLVDVARGPVAVQPLGPHRQMPDSEITDRPDRADAPKTTPEIRISARSDSSSGIPKESANMQEHGLVNNAANEKAAHTAGGNRNTASGNPMLSATGSQPSVADPLQENNLRADSPSVPKAVDETTMGKDGSSKVDSVLNSDAGTRVVKAEGGSNDGGQWTSQNQTSEKSIETASSTREAESTRRELQTHTMEQIVRRAVFQIKDGQQEARIDLKPDFLGHVRMQVITENQVVTVKILTEFGFVKDMLENNIQQLKADLNQQGLEVDKVDVSVSRDSNGKNNQNENMEQAGNQSAEKNTENDGRNTADEQEDTNDRKKRRADGLSSIDYFA